MGSQLSTIWLAVVCMLMLGCSPTYVVRESSSDHERFGYLFSIDRTDGIQRHETVVMVINRNQAAGSASIDVQSIDAIGDLDPLDRAGRFADPTEGFIAYLKTHGGERAQWSGQVRVDLQRETITVDLSWTSKAGMKIEPYLRLSEAHWEKQDTH